MLALETAAFWLTPGEWGANAVTVGFNLAFTPAQVTGLSATNRQVSQLNYACNDDFYFEGMQTVPTSITALALGGVTNYGYLLLHNADNLNYISVFAQSSGGAELIRLLPGMAAMWPMAPSATPYVQANTASCNMEIYLVSK